MNGLNTESNGGDKDMAKYAVYNFLVHKRTGEKTRPYRHMTVTGTKSEALKQAKYNATVWNKQSPQSRGGYTTVIHSIKKVGPKRRLQPSSLMRMHF